jgi:ferritin-like metal-binding protein YciE
VAAELLTAWLNDAYALADAQTVTLERFAEDFVAHSDIRSELRQHLVETKDQMEDLEDAIHELGGKVAKGKTSLPDIIVAVKEMSSSPYHDELVKDLRLLYAAEHYEHILYMSIAEASRRLNEDDIADTCERLADEAMAMAEWAEEQLPTIVTSCLNAAIKEE